MENKIINVTLEEVIKNNLANYEARYDTNDWPHMESMLTQPNASISFNWKPVFIVFIGLLVLGGGYLLFTTFNFNKITEKPIENIPNSNEEKKQATPAKTIVIPPARITRIPVTPPPVTEETEQPPQDNQSPQEDISIVKKEEKKEEMEEKKEEKEAKISEEAKAAAMATQRKKDLEDKAKKEERDAKNARKKVLDDAAKNNEVAEKKTTEKKIEKKTTEKETEKKTKPKTSTGIGLNIFSTITTDSLKKYKERLEKDSVK